ncbi:hypothetical protein AAMO2058_000089500 [Amorphochlora amoebiformis]
MVKGNVRGSARMSRQRYILGMIAALGIFVGFRTLAGWGKEQNERRKEALTPSAVDALSDELHDLRRTNNHLSSQLEASQTEIKALKSSLSTSTAATPISQSTTTSKSTWGMFLPVEGQEVESGKDYATSQLVPLPREVRLLQDEQDWPLLTANLLLESGPKTRGLDPAFSWFTEMTYKFTGIPLHIRGNPSEKEICHPKGTCHKSKSSKFTVFVSCPECKPKEIPQLYANETYYLRVNPRKCDITANSYSGVMRALATLIQLILPKRANLDSAGPTQTAPEYVVAAVEIRDFPRFAWRGLLVDTVRHFMDVDILPRIINACATVKLNTVHLHLSDDQGFRMESPSFPKLVSLNSSDGHYYTSRQLKALVRYAADRGVRIVPEIDVPGHATALLVAYPELWGDSERKVKGLERAFGVFENIVDIKAERVFDFVSKLVGDVSRVFPDKYLHLGGDEVVDSDTYAAAKMRKKFFAKINSVLQDLNRTLVGWDELLVEDALPEGSIAQVWRPENLWRQAERKNIKVLWSEGFYLDLLKPTAEHYLADPLAETAETYEKIVVGGEACMWSELVTGSNIESRLWPRGAGIAERLWSSKGVRNVKDLHRRIRHLPSRLEAMGASKQLSNQMILLRRLSCGSEAKSLALLTISQILLPFGLRKRIYPPRYTTLTPLTRLVDALSAESPISLHFSQAIRQFLDNPPTSYVDSPAHQILQSWLSTIQALLTQLSTSPHSCSPLVSLAPLFEALERVVAGGIRGLGLLVSTKELKGSRESLSGSRELGEALNQAESLSAQYEIKVSISSPLRKVSVALGGGDPPPGGYQDTCVSCTHNLEVLACRCLGRGGSPMETKLKRPFSCNTQGIDNQNGCLVCVRENGEEGRGVGSSC